jgi:hypothetical protein
MKIAILLCLLAIAAGAPAKSASLRVTPPQFGPQGDLINYPKCGYLHDEFLELLCDGLED